MKKTNRYWLPILSLLCLFSQTAKAQQLIVLDYRYDNGYFSKHPERKIPLEYAASLWEKVLVSDRRIKAGTELQMRKDFTQPGEIRFFYPKEVPAFVVFVYAYDFSKAVTVEGKPESYGSAKAMGGYFDKNLPIGHLAFNTHLPKPWYFDQSPGSEYDVPVKDVYDLITSSVHELGHALGFVGQFTKPYIHYDANKQPYFSGPAVLKINQGQPVPMTKDLSHIRGDWWNKDMLPLPPIDRHVMHTFDPVQGYRQLITAIDLAIMEDIGWQVDYKALPRYPYQIATDPRKGQQAKYFGIEKGRLNPKGLWLMDQQAHAGSAIVGRPLRYSPPSKQRGNLAALYHSWAVRIPKGGFLYCVPELNANPSGGSKVNSYSLFFDLSIPKPGLFYALYSSDPENSSDASLFINPQGQFGVGDKGYSREKLKPGQFYRLGVVIDAALGQRRYYINGQFSHAVQDLIPNGRFTLNSTAAQKPFFLLFADNNGEDADIDVKAIGLYDKPLTDRQMQQLGDSSNTQFGLQY